MAGRKKIKKELADFPDQGLFRSGHILRLGWVTWVIAIISGIAGALAYEPINWCWLIPLTPLGSFIVIRYSPSLFGVVIRTLLLGWIYYFGSLHWLLEIRRYAPAPWIGVIGVVLLGVYLASFLCIMAYISRRWFSEESPAGQFFMFGLLWLFFEWFRTAGLMPMPLPMLGHAWAKWPIAIQIAEWFGEYGVSAEVLFLAAVLFYLGRWVIIRKAPTRIGIVIISLFLVVWPIVSWTMYRYWEEQIKHAERSDQVSKVNIALLQPNIPQIVKLSVYAIPEENQAERQRIADLVFQKHEALLKRYEQDVWDLVVMPEATFLLLDVQHNRIDRNQILGLSKSVHADLIFGADRFLIHNDVISDVFNSAWMVHENGNFAARPYDKIKLVPFGETVPYLDRIPGFQEGLVGIQSFTPGTQPVLFPLYALNATESFNFGPLICFESTFSSLARQLAQTELDALVVLTNDAWYGSSAGAAHHFNVSLIRAVETRRWVLRCANTGISAIISPSGRIIASLGLNKEGIVQGTITSMKHLPATLFSYLGGIIPILLLFLLVVRKTIMELNLRNNPAATPIPKLPDPKLSETSTKSE